MTFVNNKSADQNNDRSTILDEEDVKRNLKGANLKCTKNLHNGQVVYETLDTILPNTDLVVADPSHFHENFHEIKEEEDVGSSAVVVRAIAAFMHGKKNNRYFGKIDTVHDNIINPKCFISLK